MATDDRAKALEAALGQIEKQFGKGSIMRMGENLHMNIESIPTGALALDMALGIGGLPRGRIISQTLIIVVFVVDYLYFTCDCTETYSKIHSKHGYE